MQAEIFIPIGFFALVAFIFYSFFKYRIEKQALLDKNITAESLKEILGKTSRIKFLNEESAAKWGIILIALGLAILIGIQFTDEVMLGFIFLFPGIGLLFYYYFIAKKVGKSEE